MKIAPMAGAAVVAVALLAGVLLYRSVATPGTAPDLRDPARVAAGEAIYARHCAACHGSKLEGQRDWTTRLPNGRLPAPPHDDSGHTWHHPNEVLFAVTKNGLQPPYAPAGYASDMPAFADRLTDEEIWNVVAFIQSRWSVRARSVHDRFDREHAEQRRGR